jgi:nitric oxide reductase large subunit
MTIGKLIVLVIIAILSAIFYFNWDLTKDPQSSLGTLIIVITALVGVTAVCLSSLLLIKVIITTWDKKLPFIK